MNIRFNPQDYNLSLITYLSLCYSNYYFQFQRYKDGRARRSDRQNEGVDFGGGLRHPAPPPHPLQAQAPCRVCQ